MAVPAEVVDRGEVDGDAVEIGGLKILEKAEQEDADHDAVGDDDRGLAAVTNGDLLDHGHDTAADGGEGLAAIRRRLVYPERAGIAPEFPVYFAQLASNVCQPARFRGVSNSW